MATEVNSFFWPGPDLASTPDGQYTYGELPAIMFEALTQKILAAGRMITHCAASNIDNLLTARSIPVRLIPPLGVGSAATLSHCYHKRRGILQAHI